MTDPVKKYLAAIGRRGGQAAGGQKAAASRENGKQPCGPGKKRGWPKGKKRKPAKRKSSNTKHEVPK